MWLEAADGVRSRVVVWPEGKRGTVFLFPGRTEWAEKYADAAAHMSRHGYAALAVDWRGQGLTARPKHDRHVGHIDSFADYQHDVRAALAHAREAGLPRPYHVLAHSMGGLIALRSLMEGQPFERAVFSAPMWGLPFPPHRRLAAWTLSTIGAGLGLADRAMPASGKVADPAGAPFEGNLLTNDEKMFAWMKGHLQAEPDLALGGPSIGWVRAALHEMHALARREAPSVPCLALLGTDEGIVDPDAIHVRLASWPDARLEPVIGGRHEVLMEDAQTRRRLYDMAAEHFGGASLAVSANG